MAAAAAVPVPAHEYTCTAIPLNSSTACGAPADPKPPNFFCTFHARQCQALYLGYKRRSAELEKLEKSPPKCLPKNWANIDYTSIDSLDTLREIQDYLWRRYRLLTRCLEARDWHHKHFYKDTSDFGHQAYIDQLHTHRQNVSRALTNIEKRSLKLSHERAQWQSWIAQLEAEEDAHHEAEKKKNKAGTALFKENAARLQELKQQEELRRKREREVEEVWDPIEDIIQDQRAGYVALLKVLIQHETIGEKVEQLARQRAQDLKMEVSAASNPEVALSNALAGLRLDQDDVNRRKLELLSRSQGEMITNVRPIAMTVGDGPATEEEEERERERLVALRKGDPEVNALYAKLGELASMERGANSYDLGDTETAIKQIRKETSAIREYLLIRIISRNYALLGIALKCKDIDEFLHHPEIRNTDLRDLALVLNKPSLKQIRNACADYWAAEGAKLKADASGQGKNDKMILAGTEVSVSDVQEFTDRFDQKITVCGKVIHNYPESYRMPRRGWFQFAMLTGTGPETAFELCNSWDEFYELNHLKIQGYFYGLPNTWCHYNEPVTLQHARRCGFVPYHFCASTGRHMEQTPRRGGGGRMHAAAETRNYVCAIMGRDVPGARRFISIANTWRSEVVIWARDCLTGEVIYDPPEDQKWLVRTKSGAGRFNKHPWTVQVKFDKKFKENVDKNMRSWKVNFKDCIDIVIWSRRAGDFAYFTTQIVTMLHKAFKYRDHLAVITPTIQVYASCSAEEEGPNGPRTRKAREILSDIAKYRKNHSEKDMKGDNEGMYYDDVDMEIDITYGVYDNDPHWAFEKNEDGPGALYDIGKMMTEARTEEERKRLGKFFFWKMFMGAMEHRGVYKEDETQNKSWIMEEMDALFQKNKQDETKALALPEDDGDEDWVDSEDDEFSDMDSLDEFWRDVHCDAADLEEWGEDFAEYVYKSQLERDPEAEARFQEAKRNHMRLRGKELNARQRKRSNAKERELMSGGGARFTPKNLTYCQVMTMFLFDYRFAEHHRQAAAIDPADYEAIFDKKRRAANPPRGRPWKAPLSVYEEWDKIQDRRTSDRNSIGKSEWDYPEEWRKEILCCIMRLWKSGVLQPSYDSFSGPLIAGHIPDDKKLYMFCDFRFLERDNLVQNPYPNRTIPPPSYLLEEMEAWEAQHPGSCYTLFKVKSEELYWERDLDPEDGLPTLEDPLGRCWEWKKHPKDIKYGETEMHEVLEMLRLGPGDKGKDSVWAHTRVRIDTILVMHENEEEAREDLPMVASFFRKRPMGSDLDWARSFLNVDAQFLRDLHPKWWE